MKSSDFTLSAGVSLTNISGTVHANYVVINGFTVSIANGTKTGNNYSCAKFKKPIIMNYGTNVQNKESPYFSCMYKYSTGTNTYTTQYARFMVYGPSSEFTIKYTMDGSSDNIILQNVSYSFSNLNIIICTYTW